MPTYWDPRLILEVYPFQEKFKCTGTTTKGERCGPTFIDKKYESDRILTYGLDERMKLSV